MKTLPPDLEALMPEPVIVGTSRFGSIFYAFTADQVRAVMLAVTERDAKLAADLAHDAAIKYANGREVDFEQEVAAAIRGDGGQT
jgi:hypothetical protein